MSKKFKHITTNAGLTKWVREAAPGDRASYEPSDALLEGVYNLHRFGAVFPYQVRSDHSTHHVMKLSPEGHKFVNWVGSWA